MVGDIELRSWVQSMLHRYIWFLLISVVPVFRNLNQRNSGFFPGKKSELKNLGFWLLQNLKEPAVFIFWFSDYLRMVVMRLENRLDNQPWGFDAMIDTPTTITRSFGHEGYESTFLRWWLLVFAKVGCWASFNKTWILLRTCDTILKVVVTFVCE